ncbi:MAG: hypothetical protein PHD04_04600 [Candidatus Pacebacteria bacterium]|nr:hypothetical protein [Candidatus Paceibacterota bacterium]
MSRVIGILLFSLQSIFPAVAQTVTPPQTPPGVIAVQQSVQAGFNLLVNRFAFALDVANTFGSRDYPNDATWTTQTIWVWNTASSNWEFWSPQLTLEENANYAQEHGYGMATVINPGQGYWLNSAYNTSLPRIVGEEFQMTPEKFSSLPDGWNIVGVSGTPSQFNRAVDFSSGTSCVVPTGNFETLWAWEPGTSKWIFYAPKLEAMGGTVAADFATAHGYLDGTWWWLQFVGAWANKIKFSQVPPTPGTTQNICLGTKG